MHFNTKKKSQQNTETDGKRGKERQEKYKSNRKQVTNTQR